MTYVHPCGKLSLFFSLSLCFLNALVKHRNKIVRLKIVAHRIEPFLRDMIFMIFRWSRPPTLTLRFMNVRHACMLFLFWTVQEPLVSSSATRVLSEHFFVLILHGIAASIGPYSLQLPDWWNRCLCLRALSIFGFSMVGHCFFLLPLSCSWRAGDFGQYARWQNFELLPFSVHCCFRIWDAWQWNLCTRL